MNKLEREKRIKTFFPSWICKFFSGLFKKKLHFSWAIFSFPFKFHVIICFFGFLFFFSNKILKNYFTFLFHFVLLSFSSRKFSIFCYIFFFSIPLQFYLCTSFYSNFFQFNHILLPSIESVAATCPIFSFAFIFLHSFILRIHQKGVTRNHPNSVSYRWNMIQSPIFPKCLQITSFINPPPTHFFGELKKKKKKKKKKLKQGFYIKTNKLVI